MVSPRRISSCVAVSLIGLLPSPPADVRDGKVMFDGTDLLKCSADELRRVLEESKSLRAPLLVRARVSTTWPGTRGVAAALPWLALAALARIGIVTTTAPSPAAAVDMAWWPAVAFALCAALLVRNAVRR